MDKLTTSKTTDEMSMVELTYNNVFNKDNWAWYRDFDREISCIDFIRELYKKHEIKVDDEFYTDNECFEDRMLFMMESIDDDLDLESIIVILYVQLWSKCNLRGRLMGYEDTDLTTQEVEQFKQINVEFKEKLIPKEPLVSECEEFQCPYCSEVIDESDSYIQCIFCKQVLDWRGI